ncbi:MAG: hypothetical protein NT154_44320 [Verrucomicrobia bacterium]|nr:hypothetical protein [Verrucomicrobiota bacterium]
MAFASSTSRGTWCVGCLILLTGLTQVLAGSAGVETEYAGYAKRIFRETADQGIAACRLAIMRETNSAPAHYYLGLNLGQLARTKGLGALKLVDQMEREFNRAHDLDEL